MMSTLLFVHIGTHYPKYLLRNIERTRKLFKNHKIALVGNASPEHRWLKNYDIYFKRHENNSVFDAQFSFGEFEKNFRSGYWRYTLERLLALELYHRDFPDEKLIHLESDVIIFPNFPFEKINDLSRVTWMNHSSTADIASIVFSPSWLSSKDFSSQLIEEYSNGGGSDMDVLLRLRMKNSQYAILPTLNEANLNLFNTQLENLAYFSSSETSRFRGIFDALGIGMWISGVDPRNKFGFTVIHARELIDNGIIFIDPSKMIFHLSKEGNLFVQTLDDRIPIYNLHVHSKDRDLLSIKWKARMEKLLAKKKSKKKIIGFSPLILYGLIKSNIKNRSLTNFVLQIPVVRKTKSRYSSR